MTKVKSSEITPEHIYLSRRKFMVGIGAVAVGSLLAACETSGAPTGAPAGSTTGAPTGTPGAGTAATTMPGSAGTAIDWSSLPVVTPRAGGDPMALRSTDELGDTLNTYDAITNYNNYYEFTTSKEGVAKLSQGFVTEPWTVTVGGLVRNPQTFSVDDMLKRYTQQERIYRLRCVEAWSMVIPWIGFPLSELLKEVEPTSDAKYVRFETLYDPKRMPGQSASYYQWPYVEGLRLDEAMNELAILATGLYGKLLPNQDGAPLRVVVPWKYGFKSIKAIVKIDLVAVQPTSLWMAAAPNEYGFYANVNPDVSHPRWSQASERRIGELSRRKTLSFNGYAEEVSALYAGMDLRKNY